MTSKERIIRYVEKYIALDEDEQLQFMACFKEMRVKKRQFIIQPGFTAKFRNYVLEGSFRDYVIADEGVDSNGKCIFSIGSHLYLKI